MQAADLALPRGGGPGEGQKKTPSRWPGVWESAFEPVVRLEGYFRCLGVCPRFCSEELSRFRGIGFFSQLIPPGRGFSNLLTAGSDPGFPSRLL